MLTKVNVYQYLDCFQGNVNFYCIVYPVRLRIKIFIKNNFNVEETYEVVTMSLSNFIFLVNNNFSVYLFLNYVEFYFIFVKYKTKLEQ